MFNDTKGTAMRRSFSSARLRQSRSPQGNPWNCICSVKLPTLPATKSIKRRVLTEMDNTRKLAIFGNDLDDRRRVDG